MNASTDARPDLGGPVSAALEADLRSWVRRHGVVVWLDLDDHYTALAGRLGEARAAGALPYDVHTFRGSHLALMLALEGVAGGTEKVPLVIHLPGFNEDAVGETPLLELYAAGVRYRKAVDTLVTEAAAERVPPERIAAFVAQPGLSVEGADAWLAALLDAGTGGLVAQLHAARPAAVLDDLLDGGFFAQQVGRADGEEVLWEQLAAWTGLPAAWKEAAIPTSQPRPEDVAFATASWALCVEYVDDLKRAPVDARLQPAPALPRAVKDGCHALAVHLRERHPRFYRRTADETEALLAEEVGAAKAADLGEVDTFRFEEDAVLEAALEALLEGTWATAAEWAELRLDPKPGDGSFWLGQDPARTSAWQLVRGAAHLGLAIDQAGERLDVDDLESAAEAYCARGAAVDQAHRHLEQRRVALLYPQLPEFETLRRCLDRAREAWRRWADAWALDFNRLCRTHSFLPPAPLQQRTLFDDVVRPLTREPGVTAYFMVDALRYEMAEELYRALADTPASTVHLRHRLAELPTVTEVGMNVLTPVAAGGRLRPALESKAGKRFLGFSTGEFRISEKATRKRAMHDRVGGKDCPWYALDEVVNRDAESLRRAVSKARLVLVHSREIDDAGEKGVGPAVFDLVMQKLRAAWRLLRDAGVRRFVITSDHGYLLLDDHALTRQAHGRLVDPKRRHVFSTAAADHAGEVRVALADLGYDGVDGHHLMFPESTAVFDVGNRSMSFVHGGNSLQERVIPVLTVAHRAPAGSSSLAYRVVAEAREGVAGMHCIEARIEVAAQGALDFGGSQELELVLEAPEAEGVQVELCQARGKARLEGATILAPVGPAFEVFFRLRGPRDERVRVELDHPSGRAKVDAGVTKARFAVSAHGASAPPQPQPQPEPEPDEAPPPDEGAAWLVDLPEGGVRAVFEHLTRHGVVTESESYALMGSPRAARRFARELESYAKCAPFAVRIEVVGGVKRYVREGGR